MYLQHLILSTDIAALLATASGNIGAKCQML
jgi:hypothetical protein